MDATAMVGAEYWASFWEWIGDKAFIIVVIALAVEYITGRWAKPHREALEDARKLQIAELSKETVRLKTEGDQARAAIADANARTAQAELALQRMKEPRHLTEKGVKALLERMAEFKGQSIGFAVVPETNEATGLARILVGILGQYGVGMKAGYNPSSAAFGRYRTGHSRDVHDRQSTWGESRANTRQHSK
jgi:hypothetical protein